MGEDLGLVLYAYSLFIALVFFIMALIDSRLLISKNVKAKAGARFRPRVLVIVPCKGSELGLEENLKSLRKQDYKNYSVVAVVDNTTDPAVKCIKDAKIEMLVSDYRSSKSSGKVRAILSALKHKPRFEVYVIADSDVRVGEHWLRELIKPLAHKRVGIATAYPKFIPMGGFWSRVKLVWGFVGEGMMESNVTRFGWGGSLAFRKDLIDNYTIRLLSDSKYSVSDDISLTKAAKSKGLEIAYVKEAQPVVYSNDDFGRFAEWSNRQTALSILGYRKNLYYGVAFYSAEILLMVSGVALFYLVSPFFILLLLHFANSEFTAYGRADTNDPIIVIAVAIMPFIYLANLIAASRLRHITWRGTRYRIG